MIIKCFGLRAEVLEQPITETLEQKLHALCDERYRSRAIPEIDGFKPSHRKLLYTMYKMNLLTGAGRKAPKSSGNDAA
jgi:DNA gyrase subunit A